MKKYRFLVFSFLLSVLVMIGTFSLVRVGASPLLQGSGSPSVVSYQGYVTDDGIPYTGTGYFKFAVVNAVGDTSYWSNDGTSTGGAEPAASVQLTVTDGLFHVLLGDTDLANMTALDASVFDDTERYLRIWFSADGSTYTQLDPDRRIAAVPYALQAQEALVAENLSSTGPGSGLDADLLDSIDSNGFIQSGQTDSITSDMIQDGEVAATDLKDGASLAEIEDDDGAGSGLDADMVDGQQAVHLGIPSGAILMSNKPEDTTLINAGFSRTGGELFDSWNTKTDMLTGRRALAAAAVDGKIYVLGGVSFASDSETLNEEYDPVTDSWTTKAAMPTGRNGLAAVGGNGKVYAMGGNSSANSYDETANEAYDPDTNSWTTMAAMPTGRSALAAAALGDKIYVIGGKTTTEDYETANEAYNTVTDSWATKTAMPTGRPGLAVAAANQMIYAIGGNSTGGPETVNEAYDPI